MLDRHDAHENRNQKVRDTRDAAVTADRPVADREVPLPEVAAADTMTDVLNMWPVSYTHLTLPTKRIV